MKLTRFLLLVLVAPVFTLSFAVCGQAQSVDFLAQFTGTQTHATSVVQATDGNFYGATVGDNEQSYGTIFRMTPTGELSTIYTFCSLPNCADGQQPYTGPFLGSDGNLYGVNTAGGNSTGSGILYKLTLGGKLTVVYTFCALQNCADGQVSNGVIQGRDGNFYGTTEGGGAYNAGTFFQITPAGKLKVLHSFCSQANCTDGSGAHAIQGIDGNFYGTGGGGALGGGAFYQITPGGSYKVLYNFCFYTDVNCTAGSYPMGIVQDAKGNFFGTTEYAGHNGYGTVFEITPQNQYHVLHYFDRKHGKNPIYGLTLGKDGNFYGTTNDASPPDNGTLFEITPTGVYTPLYTFGCCTGYDPWSPLFQGTDGLLYGTTLYGVGACCYGTIFSLDNGLSPLVETVPTGGKAGQSIIILGNGLTGSTSVKFNGVAASFTAESDTYIKAKVPIGATTGIVSVVTPSGTLNSNPQFVVTR